VDRLARLAVDRRRAEAIRLSAVRALGDLDRRTLAPLLSALADDPSAAVRAEAVARRGRRRSQANPGEVLDQAADLGLPDDPDALHRAIGAAGNEVALTVLLKIVERVREHETGMKGTERLKWSEVRAAAHAALANRGSRLGVYDLRESLETSDQGVPVEFLSALGVVGDASCLEAIAAAYPRSRDGSFRKRLADVFQTIVRRDRLTRRHAVLKKIQKRYPGTLERLLK
jgi:HEAT repeat protein